MCVFYLPIRFTVLPARANVYLLFTGTFSFVLQQYVMLHDMVATHSTVRVTVYRGENGMAQSEENAFSEHLSIFVMAYTAAGLGYLLQGL